MSQDGGGRGRGGLLKLMETFCGDKESVGRGTIVDATIGRGSIDFARSSGLNSINQVSISGRDGIRQPSTMSETNLGRGNIEHPKISNHDSISQIGILGRGGVTNQSGSKSRSSMDPSISLGRGRFIQESATNTVIGFGRGGASVSMTLHILPIK